MSKYDMGMFEYLDSVDPVLKYLIAVVVGVIMGCWLISPEKIKKYALHAKGENNE